MSRLGFCRVLLVLVIGGLAGSVASSRADDRPPGGRFALLVGVRQYYATDLRELDYAEADVTDLARVFLDQGYRPEDVVLMTLARGAENVRRLPMGERIRHELRLLLQGRRPEDSVVVALAGHGIKPTGSKTSYFCPIDSNLNEVRTLLPLDEVYAELEAYKAGTKLLMVDACRNDPLAKVTRGRPQVALESLSRPGPLLGVLRFTNFQLYRLDGKSLQVRGVFPNIHIPTLGEVSNPGEGGFPNALASDEVPAVAHDLYGRVPSDLVAVLESRSRGRRDEDPAFQDEAEEIRRFLRRKALPTIALDEARYRADWGDDTPAASEDPEGRDPIWKSDAYNGEILAIVADYLSLGSAVVNRRPTRPEATYTFFNDDAVQTLHLSNPTANGLKIDVAPRASQPGTFPAFGGVLYFKVPGGQDTKDWAKLPLRRGGAVRFKVVDGQWKPESR